MRSVRALLEIERKQRDALFSNREALWRLAHAGFARDGRGLVFADGNGPGRPPLVSVAWRVGTTLLDRSREAYPWIRETADEVRSYDPRTEFVLQYLSPRQEVHVYRLTAPTGDVAKKPSCVAKPRRM